MSGDDTTVIQAVLACDTERTQLLKQEQTLLTQLNRVAPDQSKAATANGHAATPNGHAATANGHAATADGTATTAGAAGATAAEHRDSNGAKGAEVDGKAADAAESKAASQLAQVHMLCPNALNVVFHAMHPKSTLSSECSCHHRSDTIC